MVVRLRGLKLFRNESLHDSDAMAIMMPSSSQHAVCYVTCNVEMFDAIKVTVLVQAGVQNRLVGT